MKHRESDHNRAIDRVLTGLSEVDPPQGMQQRILRVARERAAARRQSSLQLLFVNRYPWMVAAASIAVIALAGLWTNIRSHRNPPITTHQPEHSAPFVAQVLESRPALKRSVRPRPAIEPTRPRSVDHSLTGKTVSDDDALALSEMNAPSNPAPPMPLTEQEKLLIQILDKDDPIELAMLDPGVRKSQEIGEQADFDRFFKQPPRVVQIKLPLNNKPSTGDEK